MMDQSRNFFLLKAKPCFKANKLHCAIFLLRHYQPSSLINQNFREVSRGEPFRVDSMVIKAKVNESKRNENVSINYKSKCGDTCEKFMSHEADCRMKFMKLEPSEWQSKPNVY